MFGAWLSTLSEAAVVTAANASTSTGLTSLTLVNKGLLTTLLGLLGVFLVLLLFNTFELLFLRPNALSYVQIKQLCGCILNLIFHLRYITYLSSRTERRSGNYDRL